ncbi:metallophosphoesterase [Paraburkholderia atlantica]|uniref:Metallophosphoesterase n=1 Tax=Paraburkholderia atlantica TaxID=2654982 RepID=D5WDH1_PARAM|nr:metallophosphoesterase [Paraburkholderia atlantica]
MSTRKIVKTTPADEQGASIVSRRGFLKFAGASSLATAAGALASTARAANSGAPDGTPEQIHLTWGSDPTSEVTVSWSSLAPAVNPQVRISGINHGDHAKHTVHAVQSTYTDGINGEIVFNYHARVRDLKADTIYQYEASATTRG